MLNIKIIKYLIPVLAFIFAFSFCLTGCFKVYPGGQEEVAMQEHPPEEHFEERPDEPQPEEHFEEPPPGEEHPEEHMEEPPPEEHPEEHPPEEPKQHQEQPESKKVPENEVKERCFHAAQYEIENHSIYSNVTFKTAYDDKCINKVTGRDYCYECTIEFLGTDTNLNKDGHFIWTFVVSYDQNSNNCNVETGAKQSESFGKTKTVN